MNDYKLAISEIEKNHEVNDIHNKYLLPGVIDDQKKGLWHFETDYAGKVF